MESHEEQQYLDKDQEKVLGRYIFRLDDCGFPLKVKMVTSIAASLIATKEQKKKRIWGFIGLRGTWNETQMWQVECLHL